MMRSILTKFSTLLRYFREGGIRGSVTFVRDRLGLHTRLLVARSVRSVTLDGCTFDLDRVPNSSMKVALLDGKYEDFERHAVLKYVNPELPIIELGGCIGVVACIANRMLRNPLSHIVVEANPFAIPLLEQNRTANQCKFQILNSAIAYGPNAVTFSPEKDLWGNSLRRRENGDTVTVQTVRLQDIVRANHFDSFTLICDIEGHEYELVQNEAEIVRRADTLILEIHPTFIGENQTMGLLDNLKQLGLTEIAREACVVVLKRSLAPAR